MLGRIFFIKSFILISLIAVELLCAPVTFAEEKAQPLLFVINSAVNPLLNKAFVNETIETIRRNVYPRRLEVKYVELPEIEEMMEKKTADFYLAIGQIATARGSPESRADFLLTPTHFLLNRYAFFLLCKHKETYNLNLCCLLNTKTLGKPEASVGPLTTDEP